MARASGSTQAMKQTINKVFIFCANTLLQVLEEGLLSLRIELKSVARVCACLGNECTRSVCVDLNGADTDV